MENVYPCSTARPDTGYLAALGYLQIGAGSLTLVMSALALLQTLLGHGAMLDPATVFGLTSGLTEQAISTYVALQLSVGWIVGALQLAAGIACLRGRHPRLVLAASAASLANFPHGTMAAILMLHGLQHGVFRPDQAEGT